MWCWVTLFVVILVLLTIDLAVHRHGRASSVTAAIVWSAIWVGAGLAFNLFVLAALGAPRASSYLATYAIEKSLSVDNMFVFLLIFQTLKIPKENQHTVLSWGIFGALLFRALFIGLGAAALERWSFTGYVFGAILMWAGYRAARQDPRKQSESRVVAWLARHLPVTKNGATNHFLTRENGRRALTPLALALIAIELSDILFAIDSVPAALSITRDRFVVYSSNAFAILGLRALYLVVARGISHLRYLHFGVATVLLFAGFKIVTADFFEVPPLISTGIVVVCIGLAVGLSLLGDGHRGFRGGASRRSSRAASAAARGG
jgi:tellurite resistance protein TerC